MIFDPAAENYFKLSVPAWQMLSRYDRDMSVKEFGDRLRRSGIPADPVEILTLKQFLVQNNLLTPDAETFAAQAAQRREAKNKHLWLKVASAYLYFKLPPLHPQQDALPLPAGRILPFSKKRMKTKRTRTTTMTRMMTTMRTMTRVRSPMHLS